ncbi:hypothetical protein [Archangium lansingense]|uniref:Uncharacterized protein n=1 Tax=Archangium lansingense TaxID=2995310 RepID=A0ABT3ZZP6_9BACT|nr:hypothetical protein [Archangium lansinium]MCY1074828.1 hypothetical protein [Archangium lansinium]
MRLSEATRLYEASRGLGLHDHVIDPPLLRALEWAIQHLHDVNREAEEDGTWRAFWIPVLRFRRDVYASGLPLDRPELLSSEDAQRYQRASDLVIAQYPQHQERIAALRDAFSACRASSGSPVGDRLVELLLGNEQVEVGLFTNNEALRGAAEQFLRERTGKTELRVLRKSQLGEVSIGGTLVISGPLQRFPPQITLAPRASTLHVVRYEWSNSARCEAELLPDARGKAVQLHEWSGPVPSRARVSAAESSLLSNPGKLHELLRRLDVDGDAVDDEEGPHASDPVSVRLVRLAGGKCIFLEVGSRVRVLQLPEHAGPDDGAASEGADGSSDEGVHRGGPPRLVGRLLDVDKLVPGLFLIERRGRGGSSIDLLARRLHGRDRQGLEQIQSKWKQRLSQAIENRGIRSICDELSERCPTTPVNLRNWASDRVFLPEDPQHFRALMEFLGFGDNAEFLWLVGKALQAMNRDTGREMSQRLLKELTENVDPAELAARGYMELEFKGIENSGLSASRIESCPEEDLVIPRGRARRFFDEDLLDSVFEE